MPDRENVISGLRSIKTYLASQAIETTDSFAREGFIESQKYIDDALALLEEQPEIVRCKDCIYNMEKLDVDLIWCSLHEFGREIDYYCADGKRKSD